MRTWERMFLTIAIVLLVLWILAVFVLHVVGFFIHVLLLLVAGAIIWHFIKSRTGVRNNV